MNERCMCGALDCVACRGPSAKYALWCDECPYLEDCNASPGDERCQRKQDDDEARLESQLERLEARRQNRWGWRGW